MTITRAAVSAVLFALPLVALAEEPPPAEADASETEIAVQVSGVQVAIDPETGRLRPPTAAESAELAEQFRRLYLDRSADEPAQYHADGMVTKRLGTRHHNFTVAHVGADGELDTACVAGAEQAAEYFQGGEETQAEETPAADGTDQ